MKFVLLVILPLVAWGAPAATVEDHVESEDGMKPLIRIKRADEEIVFGNHQNEARLVKKSDPSLGVIRDDEAIDAHPDDASATSADVGEEKAAFGDDAKSAGGVTDDGRTNDKTDQDGGENSAESEPEEDETEESSGDAEEGHGSANNKDVISEEDYFDYIYPYAGMESYFHSRQMHKRALPGKPLTADNAASGELTAESNVNQRYKRDLTAEELYEWLEGGDRGNDIGDNIPRGYYRNEEVEDRPDDDDMKELALELLQEDYPEEAANGIDYLAYKNYDDDEIASNKELLSLLDYLEKGTPVLERRPMGELDPEEIQEKWEDLDTEPDQQYEPIIYHGVPGIFIPMEEESPSQNRPIQKRQYLSMLPGQKKRNFYPYNLEPVGGRWGAFVSPEEEKRTSDAYDRLYRMAEALNPRNSDYNDYK